jgi:hypothetical protein
LVAGPHFWLLTLTFLYFATSQNHHESELVQKIETPGRLGRGVIGLNLPLTNFNVCQRCIELHHFAIATAIQSGYLDQSFSRIWIAPLFERRLDQCEVD